jgi:hypothetical protein
MSNRHEYKVLSANNPAHLGVELNQLGLEGWKPILMSAAHASGVPAGISHVIITVILEHDLVG